MLVLVVASRGGDRRRTEPAETAQQADSSQPVVTTAQPDRPDASRVGATGEITIDVDGLQRVFTVVRPPSVGANAALVVLLHGGGRNMRAVLDGAGTGDWVALAEEKRFILVAPNGVNPATGDTTGDRQQWNDLRSPFSVGDSEADDVEFINRVIDWVIEHHDVDPDRVFVTGLSNGGMMAQRLLIETPETFAAGASFIANLPDRDDLVGPDSPVPLLLANGTEDPLMPWDGGKIADRDRGTVKSVAETREWWIKTNRATPDGLGIVQIKNTNRRDGCTLTTERFNAGPGGAALEILTMEGGGHSMPSTNYTFAGELLLEPIVGPLCRDAGGVRLAWEFFVSS